MTKIALIAAAALLVSAGAIASAPSAASEAATEISGRQLATDACLAFNQYGPVRVEQAVGDGVGDWIVWVRDRDSDLWLCNASAKGHIYANTLIRGDLLRGKGAQALALTPVAHTPSRDAGAEKAERLCAVGGRKVGATEIIATVEDGVGDFVVWLKSSDQSYWLCNASANAELYVFERVRSPLNPIPVDPAFRAA